MGSGQLVRLCRLGRDAGGPGQPAGGMSGGMAGRGAGACPVRVRGAGGGTEASGDEGAAGGQGAEGMKRGRMISIDPPWPYGTEYDPHGRRAANPYPEMSLEDIAGLSIPAADDCVLWLWTTHKFMRHSFGLIDQWGFRDVAILTWVKDRMGLGSWLRSQTEYCIMAVKGSPPIQLTNQTTVIHGPLREHSRKPDAFFDMVDGLCVGAKLDYFS